LAHSARRKRSSPIRDRILWIIQIRLSSSAVKILDGKQNYQLVQWYGNHAKQWKLLFQATRDGWGGRDFHRVCDNKGETLVVARSTSGYIFGGYTDIPWTHRNNKATSTHAWLFTLVHPAGHVAKIPIEPGKSAVHYAVNYGPLFGTTYDLCIGDNANHPSARSSYSTLSGSYKSSIGQLSESVYFVLSEYEVFAPEL